MMSPGAFEIQEVFEHAEWASQSGDATAHAPYLRKSPLAGNSRKSILIQIAKGDQTAPTPRTSATIRAGNLQDVTNLLSSRSRVRGGSGDSKNPHSFLLTIASRSITGVVARGAQRQAATSLQSKGARIIHPEPARFFEVPIAELPERLEFIR